MRGLDIRIEYATAHNALSLDPVNRSKIKAVLREAVEQGMTDFRDGECIVPAMFAGVPELVTAWSNGYRAAMIEACEARAVPAR